MYATADLPSLAPLWTRTNAMFVRAGDAIGTPAAIAALGPLTQALKHTIAGWIARLEIIVRRLLLAEAARLKLAQAPQGGTASLQARIVCAPRAAACESEGSRSLSPTSRPLDLSRPESWPARFALSPTRDPLACPEHRAPRIRSLWDDSPSPYSTAPPPPPPPPPRAASVRKPAALRLAFRFEALRRVLANPLPHARRLLALMLRVRRRYSEAPTHYALKSARPHAVDPGDPRLSIDTSGAGMDAAIILREDSS